MFKVGRSALFFSDVDAVHGEGGEGPSGDAPGFEGIAGIAQTVQRPALGKAAGHLDQPHTGGGRCEGSGWGPAARER